MGHSSGHCASQWWWRQFPPRAVFGPPLLLCLDLLLPGDLFTTQGGISTSLACGGLPLATHFHFHLASPFGDETGSFPGSDPEGPVLEPLRSGEGLLDSWWRALDHSLWWWSGAPTPAIS